MSDQRLDEAARQVWLKEMNRVLCARRSGVQFIDLDDDDQDNLLRLRDGGFTPEEAYDLLCEVQEDAIVDEVVGLETEGW